MVNLNGERFKRDGCAHLGPLVYFAPCSRIRTTRAISRGSTTPGMLIMSKRSEPAPSGCCAMPASAGARILDAGCGSGLLARTLRIEGFAVLGVDAPVAMIELARHYEPGAQFEVVRLPTRKPPGIDGALLTCDAINRPRAELPGHAY
jgi:2-polyprenyl-3-methyl-5-hydroxy-6-metoxy-1,4-benzoquinol methylase